MLIKTMLDQRGPITRGEVELLEIAEKMPIVFDKDNPELTKEDLKGFHPKGKLGRGLAQVRAGQGIVKTMEELERMAEKAEETKITQIQLPDPADADPHPRLLLEGRGIHVHIPDREPRLHGVLAPPCRKGAPLFHEQF